MTHAQEPIVTATPRPFSVWRLWLARAGWLFVFLLVTVIFIESVPSANVYERRSWLFSKAVPVVSPYMSVFTFAAVVVAVRVAVVAVFYGVALLIAFRKWNDWFALFVSAALLMVVWGFGARPDTSTYLFPAWLGAAKPALSQVLQVTFIFSWLLLFFLLPDGRFVPRQAVWVMVLMLPFILFLYIGAGSFASDLPYATRLRLGEIAWGVFLAGMVLAIMAGLFSQLYRYGHVATPTQRQQMKWILVGLAAQPLSLFFGISGPFEPWGALLGILVPLFIVSLLPITIGMAVFRRRLWDVDPLINRSLVYGGLTGFVLILYGLIVGGAGSLLESRAGIGPALVATLIAVLVVSPLYRRLDRAVARLRPVPARPAGAPDTRDAQPALDTPFETILGGRSLVAARLFWLLVTALTLLLGFVGLRAAVEADLIENMPALAAKADIALARAYSGNIYLASSLVNIASAGQIFAFLIVGLILIRRRSDDWMAILASLMCITTGIGFTPQFMFLPILRPLWALPVAIVHAVLFSSLVLFLFLFPNGRFVPAWTKVIGIAWIAYAITWPIFPELDPHLGSSPLALLIFISVVFLGLGAQVHRFRREHDPVSRQQTKWVVAGFFTANVCFFLVVAPSVFGLTEGVPLPFDLINAVLGSMAILIPITIAFAILRYRLWDIDLFINRAVVYGGLTLAIILLYILVVGGLSNLFRSNNSLLLSILVTGLIAVILNPLRIRLQHGINRLMYGDRDDPITVISELGRKLEQSAAPGDTLSTVVETVGRSLKLSYVAIAAHQGDERQIVAAFGAPQPDQLEFPLVYQSQQVGVLIVGSRAPGESFTTAERRLLNNIARQAGAAVYAAQLTDHLQNSREQLVIAREEERRRLQRDLHDGLGPQLATLGMQLEVARGLVGDSPDAVSLLEKLSAETQAAITDIRRLVYDLRPPALGQLGLAGALREYVAGQTSGTNGPRITVEGPDALPPLPAAVEVAAFRIAQEAVANCIRHAGAKNCRIILEVNGALRLEIADNGPGLPPAVVHGVGLASMRERAAELGGECRIESSPGGGVRVIAVFPLPMDHHP